MVLQYIFVFKQTILLFDVQLNLPKHVVFIEIYLVSECYSLEHKTISLTKSYSEKFYEQVLSFSILKAWEEYSRLRQFYKVNCSNRGCSIIKKIEYVLRTLNILEKQIVYYLH